MAATGQTSVTYTNTYQREGKATGGAPVKFESRFADAAIPAGRFVVIGATASKSCKLPAASGDVGNKTLGVAIWDEAKEPNSSGSDYDAGEMVSIGYEGEFWFKAEDAVTEGGAVYVRYTAGSGSQTVGRVRSDADTSKAAALEGAKFMNSTSGTDGWVRVRVSLPA
jgi:hypothetical protein